MRLAIAPHTYASHMHLTLAPHTCVSHLRLLSQVGCTPCALIQPTTYSFLLPGVQDPSNQVYYILRTTVCRVLPGRAGPACSKCQPGAQEGPLLLLLLLLLLFASRALALMVAIGRSTNAAADVCKLSCCH
jgi:MYXO-CTERM domain-containing protein